MLPMINISMYIHAITLLKIQYICDGDKYLEYSDDEYISSIPLDVTAGANVTL
jgi:hypothetical protein